MSANKMLAGLPLPDSIQWQDQFEHTQVWQKSLHLLDGSEALFARPYIGGRPITLAALPDVTWLDLTTVETLHELAAQPGAILPLVWWDRTFRVIFRHHEPPALLLRPLLPHRDARPIPAHANRYVGTIKLMEVVS
ncbi:MAG: hypothetical protein HQL66_15360 [Magnetococcales bacterium]|nr:hypothetical protein [Magnetococcales bacterium]